MHKKTAIYSEPAILPHKKLYQGVKSDFIKVIVKFTNKMLPYIPTEDNP